MKKVKICVEIDEFIYKRIKAYQKISGKSIDKIVEDALYEDIGGFPK